MVQYLCVVDTIQSCKVGFEHIYTKEKDWGWHKKCQVKFAICMCEVCVLILSEICVRSIKITSFMNERLMVERKSSWKSF